MSTAKFEVQTYTVVDGWINVWLDDGTPTQFMTRRQAQHAIGDFFAELKLAGMANSYDASDYRVQEVQS